ncbi:UDP-galactopyranose mutase [Acetonema longum DSM 6540]|uniref:UDP-galactopyranose mutase n=1 Tax=Acetonema longum DSM 6540 TaxID=1009370 RepID=F7NLX5_9FIRM|nr:UDP-galactopyranose mutase [Acetonema longum DSM 6540]
MRFEHERLDCDNYQGNAVVNYTEREIPYTRIIEHKHFEFGKQTTTVISKEYPSEWKPGDEPYYPSMIKKIMEVHCKIKSKQPKRETEYDKSDQTQPYGGFKLWLLLPMIPHPHDLLNI